MTSGIAHYLEDIIVDSKRKLILVSPYLQLSKTFTERLKEVDNKGIKATIIYGKNDISATEWKKLTGFKDLCLYFFENLHAKCYFNESKMIITSMNLYHCTD